jgi:RNA polymerase sigma-70 factor (ECF subfamily)
MSAVSEQTEVDLAGLVDEYQANVWRYLRFLGATPADADDLTQETFLAVSRSSFQQRSHQETASYLRTVARNQLLQARRREGREVDTVEITAAEQIWATVTNMDSYLAVLGDCLEKLDGRARTVINRFYVDRHRRTEIAAELNMKPEGVKTLLRRTRDILRNCIERQA